MRIQILIVRFFKALITVTIALKVFITTTTTAILAIIAITMFTVEAQNQEAIIVMMSMEGVERVD